MFITYRRLHKWRTHMMLAVAWVAALPCSTPNIFLSDLIRFPLVPEFAWCLTFQLSFPAALIRGLPTRFYFVFEYELLPYMPHISDQVQ